MLREDVCYLSDINVGMFCDVKLSIVKCGLFAQLPEIRPQSYKVSEHGISRRERESLDYPRQHSLAQEEGNLAVIFVSVNARVRSCSKNFTTKDHRLSSLK